MNVGKTMKQPIESTANDKRPRRQRSAVTWQSRAVAGLGVALLIPSAFVSWFGRDVSVVVIVSAVLVAIGLLAEVLPERWTDRIQQLEVSAAGSTVKVGFRDLTEAASSLEQVRSELQTAKDEPDGERSESIETSLELVSNVLKGLASLTSTSVLPTFRTRYLSSESDPYQARVRNGDGMEPRQQSGWLLLVTGAGTWTESALADGYSIVGRLSGPNGYRYECEIPADANPPDNWFNYSSFAANAPAGEYIAVWHLRNRWGGELPVQTDHFMVPTVPPYTVGAENERI